MKFDDLGLSAPILSAIHDMGYTEPTPIQEEVIPEVLAGHDIFGCAQTGTGKTASFVLPMIEKLSKGRAKARMPRSLILEPTRELAMQVAENFEKYGKNSKLELALLIGGESFGDQQKKLERGVDVLIATPGRLLDLFDRGKILMTDVKIFIIDEADRMLDMGFIPDIERITGLLPKKRQNLLFSATMPEEIKKLSTKYLNHPKEVVVAPPSTTASTIVQKFIHVAAAEKRRALRHLIESEKIPSAIIFCNRKKDVDIVHKSMINHGYSSGALHGDMAQSARNQVLQDFKDEKIKFLIASDVAARGLDVEKLPYVFNFDVPIQAEDYVHRIGRTGRAGNTGHAFTFISKQEEKHFKAILKIAGDALQEVKLDESFHAEVPKKDVKKERPQKAKPEKQTPSPQPKPKVQEEPKGPVVGFGDDIPAFMR